MWTVTFPYRLAICQEVLLRLSSDDDPDVVHRPHLENLGAKSFRTQNNKVKWFFADLWRDIEGEIEDDPALSPDDVVQVDAESVVDLGSHGGLEAAHGRALQGH